MDKKELINMVEEIAENTSLKDIISDKDGNKTGGKSNYIGKSQFRTMAEVCEKAQFYEEVRLMVQYKMAKGNGWDLVIKGNKKCGDVILEYMEKIKSKSTQEDLLKNISNFFGYLYWKATILTSIKKSDNQSSGRVRR